MSETNDQFNAGTDLRKRWALLPDMAFLNNGSFGATPLVVLEAQAAWRQQMERQPVDFFVRALPQLIRDAAAKLAGFLGTQPENLAFVDNATSGINAVLRAYPWQRGDEILLSQHAYPAVKQAARFVARQFGLVVNEFAVPFPFVDSRVIVEHFEAAITKHTRLAILDHVSSPLAIVYPLPALLAVCRAHGIHSLVDGAHAPGMLPLALDAIDADWYVGNCHKWLYAAKGCAFIHATPAVQPHTQPLVISLQEEAGFPASFDWTGTRDVSAWLAIGAALDCYAELGGSDLPSWLHAQALQAAQRCCAAWRVALPAPEDCFGAMVTLPIPYAAAVTQLEANAWRDRLWHTHAIEVPFFAINDRLWVRISVQRYNDMAEYEKLAIVVQGLVVTAE